MYKPTEKSVRGHDNISKKHHKYGTTNHYSSNNLNLKEHEDTKI